MVGRGLLIVLAVVVVVLMLVVTVVNVGDSHGVNVLVTAVLPKSFTVTGPYARLLYSQLGLPIGSLINESMLSNPNIRLTWHTDYLTLIMQNNSKVIIEAKAQLIQVKVNGSWLTVKPTFIKPNYTIKVIKGNETLRALMSFIDSRWVYRPIYPPPNRIMSIINGFRTLCRLNGIACSPPAPIVYWLKATHRWLMFNYVYFGFDSTPTWALSAFIDVNSTYSICGYVYPDNGSDLIIPANDYAGIPLSIYQTIETPEGSGFLFIQSIAQLNPPALYGNLWGTFYTGYLAYSYLSLTSIVDWLATGVTLCISEDLISPSEPTPTLNITLTSMVNGVNYTIGTIIEEPAPEYEENVTYIPGPGFMGTTVSYQIPVTEVSTVMGSTPYNSSIMLYPSLAFEVNDTSPLFFSNNTAFALEFEMGDEPSNVGNWPLYYSISNDTLTCSGIWGSSGVGSMWPIGSESWGASGLTIKYPSEPVSYEAIIGSISKMKNNIIINTVGITCSSVDAELSTLNTEG